MSSKTPTVLIILDGFGHSDHDEHNAIAKANTPTWDKLSEKHPKTLISASGVDVGLPTQQMGNSEVGHMNIGAGRVIHQDLTRISQAFETGSLKSDTKLMSFFAALKANDKALHLLGLLSPGGVHSHESHIEAMIRLASEVGLRKVYLHAFLDGRDTPPRSAKSSLEHFTALFESTGTGKIASLVGRYYAMDRDKRWDRVETAYQLLTEGKAPFQSETAIAALEAAYARDENDEFVQATSIHDSANPVTMEDGDGVLFMNFRADRARQLTEAFTSDSFAGFTRNKQPKLEAFFSLTEYADSLNASVIFAKATYPNVLAEVLAKNNMTQLHLAETEKYAHVTFFFNGGVETPFEGETRKLIESPKVATYDLKPEMSAPEVTEKLTEAILSRQYDFIVCNYANPDMVGHTGNFAATVKAIECIDECLRKVVDALEEVSGQMLITADHGNAEYMYNEETKQAHTAHTNLLVPLIYVGKRATITVNDGILADIAPTILYMLGQSIPTEMTGRQLITYSD